VLTTTPGGAADVVPPVDVDAVSDGSAASVAESGSGAASFTVPVGVVPVGVVPVGAGSDSGAVEFDPAGPDSDSEDASDDGVSATAGAAPLTMATPIPSATANAPTRPTYAAAPI
jgi:hypothetical protein